MTMIDKTSLELTQALCISCEQGEHDEQIIKRFLSKISIDAVGCWEWQAGLYSNGYGKFHVNRIAKMAHRISYQYFKGELDNSLVIDHLCKNKSCVNPRHLEQVTQRENVLRGDSPSAHQAKQTHCKRGHPFNKENTYVYKNKRGCRICRAFISRRCRSNNHE